MRTKVLFPNAVLLAVIFFSFSLKKPEITGLWEITEVSVGGEIMTPVAKWTKINEDGSFQNGNGWQQNSTGAWTFDHNNQLFQFKPVHGIGFEDEEGVYKVSFKEGKMIWEGEEEGVKIVVSLQRIEKLPMSPGDQLMGLWDLTSVIKDGKDSTAAFDPDNLHYLHIRWDKIFAERTPQGERSMGYWFIRGHAPEITLLSFDKHRDHEKWRISFNGSELTMAGISDTNKGHELRYTKISKFPE